MSLIYQVPNWDSRQWKKFVNIDGSAQESIDRGVNKVYSFPRFAEEVFHTLYSASDIVPLDNAKPEHKWAEILHGDLAASEEFQSLQREVEGKYYLSGLAANVFIQKIALNLPRPMKDIKDPQEVRDLVVAAKRHGGTQEEIDRLIEQGKELVGDCRRYAEEFEGSGGCSIVYRAVKAAQEAVEEAEEQMYVLSSGLEPSGGNTGIPIKEAIALAKKLSRSKLKMIMKQAGRMKRLALVKQQSKLKDVKQAVSGVRTGNDLQALIPAEFVNFKVPALRPLFLKGMVESSLLQYEKSGNTAAGKGPVVVCVDVSGSMEGGCSIWAEALAITLLGIAQSQNRHFRLIKFDEVVQLVEDFAPGDDTQKDKLRLIKAVSFFTAGGTNFTAPIGRAIECIEEESQYRGADVIFITDGHDSIDPEWLDNYETKRGELGFSLYGVQIGWGDRRECLESLMVDPSHLTVIQNLENDEAIASLFSI